MNCATTTRPAAMSRIYRQHELEEKMERAGFFLRGSHHAHAFHSPYWWLKCAYGLEIAEPAGAALPRVLLPLSRTTHLGPRHRTRPEPGARQERGSLRREGRRRRWRSGGSGALADTSSPKSPASSPARSSRRPSTRSRRCSSPTATFPWTPGRQADPWNSWRPRWRSTSAAVHRSRARLRLADRYPATPGGWHAYYVGDDVKEHALDTNVSSYVANGVWHHYLFAPRLRFLRRCFRSSSARLTSHSTTSIRPARSNGTPIRSRRRERARCSPVRRASTRRCAARSPRPNGSDGNGPTGSCRCGSLADRDRPPTGTLPRQGTLGDGLVLPDPGRRVARQCGRGAPRREVGAFVADGRRRALRLRPALDHRGRDLRARAWRSTPSACTIVPASCSSGCSSCATTTAATGPA